ncbi:sulfotransferase 4A1 [Manacus vitellinus]|uniref:sulfotransferase 4A1 n=1 Tax=Manacus vitellinus TaxID=328815 RepID=UPI0004EFE6C9|nr:sulfotransferase 4A1 [Manacus vitellinus]
MGLPGDGGGQDTVSTYMALAAEHVRMFWLVNKDRKGTLFASSALNKRTQLPFGPLSAGAGTGLLQEVVYLVSQGADPDEIGLMNIDEQLPVLEYPQPGLDIIKELTSPRLIKSHLPYRFLPSDLHNGNSKVIYMARNPKDLVVSYYQFHRSLRTMSYRGTFQEFCRRFMNDKLGYGSWFEHVQEFWEHHMDANVLFLKYEDMHKDLATMVEQLVRFLGVSYDKAQLESMVEHCHQLIDQCCNAEALPVGRGRVGLWKDIFTVSMNEKFDLVYKQKMGKCDLTFDFYL